MVRPPAHRDNITSEDTSRSARYLQRRRLASCSGQRAGVQQDGTRSDQFGGAGVRSATGGGNQNMNRSKERGSQPDYIFESRDGWCRAGPRSRSGFPSRACPTRTRPSRSGLNVLRRVQHSGFRLLDPAVRPAPASSAVRTLTVLRDLRRGWSWIHATATAGWTGRARPRDGLPERRRARRRRALGIRQNSDEGTWNPDFSQVEADIGQWS